MHNPTLIPALLRDTSVNKGLIYRELHKALPCRIGIEFEMGKLFLDGFKKKYDEKATDKSMAEHYGVFEIRSDTPEPFNPRRRVVASNNPRMDDRVEYDGPADTIDDRIIETRVSIKDYSQLVGLYRFMQDLPEFCTLHEGGGIHIHIDMSMFPYEHKPKEKEVHKWLTHRLNEIENLFPKYKGKYNRREVGIRTKSTWLNMSNKHTLEFRIPPLTFDYYTLMSWIVGIVKFRNKLIHECQLKKDWGCQQVVEKLLTDLDHLSDQLSAPSEENRIIDSYVANLEDNGYIMVSNNNGDIQYRRQGTSSCWSA